MSKNNAVDFKGGKENIRRKNRSIIPTVLLGLIVAIGFLKWIF